MTHEHKWRYAQFYKSFEGLNSRFISEDVKTGLGFTMDAEIIVDSFAKPLQVFCYFKRKHLHWDWSVIINNYKLAFIKTIIHAFLVKNKTNLLVKL